MKRTAAFFALGLAFNPLSASAQVRVGASAVAAEAFSAVSAAAGGARSSPTSFTPASLSLPSVSLSLSASPAPSISVVPVAVSISPAAALTSPAALAHPSRKVTPSVAVQKSVSAPAYVLSLSARSVPAAVPLTRSEKAAAVVRDEVANWGVARSPEDSVLAPSFALSHTLLSPKAAATPDQRLADVPAPKTPALAPGRPALSKSLLITGAVLVGVTALSAAVPALLPAAVVAYKGAFAWSGLAAMAASRFWRAPGSAPDVPRGPPAPTAGALSSFKTAWTAARDSADAQGSFEIRVGGSSWSSFRDWLFGGIRTGLYWMGPALLVMLAGAAAAKGAIMAFGIQFAGVAGVAAGAAEAGFDMIPLSYVLGSFLPMALASQAAGLALFFGVRALARKLGAGKAAPWLGGAAALGLAAGVLLMTTTAPFIVAATLALEAGVLWTAARSNSFLAPLVLRGVLTLFSIEAARLTMWLGMGFGGALVGLPAAWGGVAIAGLAAVAFLLKAPGLRLAEIGKWWNAAEPGQRPKSPWRVLSSGLLWGMIVYAVGDLTFSSVNALAPGAEPAPDILAKMLTSGVDLVLYNFVIVGLLEEYIFRRGLFKMMNERLEKWGLTLGKAFWLAAVGSALIFSGVHYIDWGMVLARFGIGDAATAAGMGGAYAFSWAGFVARSVLGVLLAWMYKRSGFLLIPIVAHFWANTMEGLGLAWGFPVFLALGAFALAVSLFYRSALKPKSS